MTLLQAFIHTYPIVSILLYSLAMLMIGSLLSMITYRLPLMLRQSELQDDSSDTSPVFNLFLPRSHCVHCKKVIPLHHNLPLLSYCVLRGRCHNCQHMIAWRYPGIEAVTLLLSLIALYHYDWQLLLVGVLVFLWLCICLTVIDLEHKILPDTLTYCLLWLGLLINTQNVFCSLSAAIWGAVAAYLSLWILIKLFYLATGKIGMGYGDFKLFAALGAWFGWIALTPILLLACVMGIIFGSLYLWFNKKSHQHPIPFGPYLCIAGVLYLFQF